MCSCTNTPKHILFIQISLKVISISPETRVRGLRQRHSRVCVEGAESIPLHKITKLKLLMMCTNQNIDFGSRQWQPVVWHVFLNDTDIVKELRY